MTPLPVNPNVVVLIQVTDTGVPVVTYASNIAPDLQVKVVGSPAEFAEETCNLPFTTTNPAPPRPKCAQGTPN